MSLVFASLNSGSNGNCYYVGSPTDAVLIDLGLSCRETERRMQACGLSWHSVRAVFISHEHSDHIRGLPVIVRKYGLPVFASAGTCGRLGLPQLPATCISDGSETVVGGLTVRAFSKYHDAAEPLSFTVAAGPRQIGIFTDIGRVCDNLIRHFKSCDAALLEANYDEALLQNGSYPLYLKKRISGGSGHLSNREALDLFRRHKPSFMKYLLLAHLSKDNNCPELALDLFRAHSGATEVSVASRYEASAVFELSDDSAAPVTSATAASNHQLSLF